MRRLPPLVPLALVALLASPFAYAQEHAHAHDNGMSVVLHDGPEDGRAVVGAYTHFGFALVGKDGAPTPHQDASFILMQDGVVLFSTTDTHEYDGLFSLDVQFTRPGRYQAIAMSGEMAMGLFEGVVVEPVNATVASVEWTATPQVPGGRVVDVTLGIVGPDGALLPHTDAIVEFRDARDGTLASRVHLHVHDEPIVFSQALGPATSYEAQVIAYQAFNRGRTPDVPAVLARFPVDVGPTAVPIPGLPAPAPPAILEQRGASASANGLTLHATYDPNNQVGVLQTARIAGTVLADGNFTPKPHVDFALTLSGPRGLVFASENGHEYDGVFEYAFVPDVPGVYSGTLRATYDETELSVPVQIEVIPPLVAGIGGTGPITYALQGADAVKAGEPVNLTFSAMGPIGPAAHSEVDVTIAREGAAPLYNFKLHTHGSGLTNAIVMLPEEGEWTLRIDGVPTVPEPSRYPSSVFKVAVAAAAPAAPTVEGAADLAKAGVPGAWAALATLGIAAAAFASRRR